jgi:transposase-like protein
MDLGRYLVERHLREGTPVAELAAAHGVHRSWLYKLLARYRAEGAAGLEPRSRRPLRSPTRISDRFEDEIVAIRKELDESGFDAGAHTIYAHLSRRHETPPSASTIWGASSTDEGSSLPNHTNGRAAPMSASSPISPTNAGKPT